MRRSEFFFFLIDHLMHPIQNYRLFKGLKKVKHVIYNDSQPKDCKADFVFDPKLLAGETKLPVLLNIHGGGFVKGDKRHRTSISQYFAHKGFFVVNVNYRVAPKHPFPATIIDCINALNSLKNFAEKYNIDLNKVAVTGDSSGAYCASMLVAYNADPSLCEKVGAPKIEVPPALLLGFCGPYDLEAALSITKLPFNLLWDIGHSFLGTYDGFELQKDFSNLKDYRYINEISPAKLVNERWCPTFLAMSKKDILCAGHGEIMQKQLEEAGVPVKTYTSEKFTDNHCFHLNFYSKAAKECLKSAVDFMNEYFKTGVTEAPSTAEITEVSSEVAAAESSEEVK